MWGQIVHVSRPPKKNQIDFRQDSTVCKACTRHVFRTEAIRCHGKCNGEFHYECSDRHNWVCGKCKQENLITKKDLDVLTSAVDDITKNLAKTDAKLTNFRVETEAGKISDNAEISELTAQVQNMHVRFDIMEKQMNAMKATVSTAMAELKTTISNLESKILALTARQIKFDQIDISCVQDTLNNASHVIITEMCRTLDRIIEEKNQLLPQKINSKGPSFEETKHDDNRKQQQQQHQVNKNDNSPRKQEKEALRKKPSQKQPTRLQQLAAQFQVPSSTFNPNGLD